jgi:hypothetical protein
LTAADLHSGPGDRAELRGQFADGLRARGLDPTPEALDAEVRTALVNAAKAKSREPTVAAGGTGLPDMPVVVADNVATYLAAFPLGTDLSDLVGVVVPPFKEMWIDIQHAPSQIALHAWGIHLTREDHDRPSPSPVDGATWDVRAVIYGEWRKNDPVGPIATFVLPLDDEGRLYEADREGHNAIFGRLVDIDGMPDEEERSWSNSFVLELGAGLLAISLMHCKNVDVCEIVPPEALARKHRRKHGLPLTRYHVLDIRPMTRVLSRDGNVEAEGLRHALHICRGHFKTFSPEDPLFGRLTGTYWWAEQVRGDPSEGVVDKDYRITIKEGEALGRTWCPTNEHTDLASASENKGRDPDLAGRGLRAHNVTLNALADAIVRAGYEPRGPTPAEPQYDIAWDDGETVWVAEVKSLTLANEEKQLRGALGQVLRYADLLQIAGKPVKAAIATECQPSDERWLGTCTNNNVVLVWNGAFDEFLHDRTPDTTNTSTP